MFSKLLLCPVTVIENKLSLKTSATTLPLANLILTLTYVPNKSIVGVITLLLGVHREVVPECNTHGVPKWLTRRPSSHQPEFCLHFSDGMLEWSSVRKKLLLRLLVCRDRLPWCRKYDGRTLRHSASLIRKQRYLNVAAELNLYRNTSQTCPELYPLRDFHGSPPYHLHFKWKWFPVTKDEKWMQCVTFSHYSFPFLPLHYIVFSWTLSTTMLRTIFILRGPKGCYP